MRIEGVPFTAVDWSRVPESLHPGQTGSATWRTIQLGPIRVRQVCYSPGYLADHWCAKGHILLVLEGELLTELQDGSSVTLRPGMSYHVGDDLMPHRSRTAGGATLFIVD